MAESLLIGCAQAEITPKVGTPLSGFIFRENKPSLGIDSPLYVRVLAVRHGETLAIMASLEVLAISSEMELQLLSALQRRIGPEFKRNHCVLQATHTHSAPPVSPLEGESEPDPDYLRLVCERTASAAEQAISILAPASLYFTSLRISGLTYNRRAILADGQVSMALHPDYPVLERGPVDDTLSVLVWRDAAGRNLAVMLHFACHGAAVCTQNIHGDIPGEISRRVGEMFAAPCIFVQGITGDVNPYTTSSGRAEMLDWADQFMLQINHLPTLIQPLPAESLRIISTDLPLVYQPLPNQEKVEENIYCLSKIAQGDVDSCVVQATLRSLADLMNFKPGERPDPGKAAFAAQALANAERRILAGVQSGQPLSPCPLRVSIWGLGKLGFVFIAAELFALTSFKIRLLSRNLALLPATYAAPIIGYLPDLDSIAQGGYEVNDAWRFYRQPAPFKPESEDDLIRFIRSLVASL